LFEVCDYNVFTFQQKNISTLTPGEKKINKNVLDHVFNVLNKYIQKWILHVTLWGNLRLMSNAAIIINYYIRSQAKKSIIILLTKSKDIETKRRNY